MSKNQSVETLLHIINIDDQVNATAESGITTYYHWIKRVLYAIPDKSEIFFFKDYLKQLNSLNINNEGCVFLQLLDTIQKEASLVVKKLGCDEIADLTKRKKALEKELQSVSNRLAKFNKDP